MKKQIMFGTILCVLLKSLILTKAIITLPKDYIVPKSLQEERVSIYSDLNFTQDTLLSEKSDHHIVNFKSDRSHSNRMTVRNERKVGEVIPFENISMMTESIESGLSKPTSLRAFVQFDNQLTNKVNDIFVTLRWNQPEFTDEVIQRYTVQCFFIEDSKEIPICDDQNITTTILDYTVHNLKPNTTYHFRVYAHAKTVAGPYTNLINVSTAHENPIPKFLTVTGDSIDLWDLDLNVFINLVNGSNIRDVAYSIQERRIYWIERNSYLMTLKMNENNITQINTLEYYIYGYCIDWVARIIYLKQSSNDYKTKILKLDLTMWENGIIKYDEMTLKGYVEILTILPCIGILYYKTINRLNKEFEIMQCELDEQNSQVVQTNSSKICSCQFHPFYYGFSYVQFGDMNELLIYWIRYDKIIVTDITVCTCNVILYNKDISDEVIFSSVTIDKTNIYIVHHYWFQPNLYVLKRKYATLESVDAYKYVEKIMIRPVKYYFSFQIYTFDKSLQPYPPMRCLTPNKKIYNFEKVTVTTNSIIVNLPEPVVKRGCKKYNLPATIYTISVNHCGDNYLNKSEKFHVQTYERYYKIDNLTPFTEYKLKFTLSNFYFDQLSINPFDSNIIVTKTGPGKLNAPENTTVLSLTPTIAVVHWMSPKKLNCVPVIYKVYWNSSVLVNGTREKSEQFIDVPKRMTDGRFFTKIHLSLLVQNYSIYVGVYPVNFNDFYNESLSTIVYLHSEPNNITLSSVNTNNMDISWIPNIDSIVSSAIEYKAVATENWQTTDYIILIYNKEVIYHIENLQPGTSYKFRLILRYIEYEENFIWPADERFIFSTLDDILDTPGIIPTKYYLSLILCVIFINIIICICYFYRSYRQHRGNEKLSPSTMTDMELTVLHGVTCQNTQFNMLYSPMLHYNPDEYEIIKISREQIILTKLLGSGAFGMVFQGNVKNLERSGTEIRAAIKMLRKDASSNEKKKFLKEARLMNHFRHEHILRLLAVCLDGDSPLLVLELMETDLLKYLRDCRNLQASDSHALRMQDLLAMCEDVARGCCYLEELRFVHRDLACRNCLVSARYRENRVIKIGDFGLAKDVYKDDYYRMKGEGLLPVRWMAPESLVIGIFTSLSDVWSFGVLMWEITSLGEQPYIGKTNEEVISYVRAGGRLPITLNCPSMLYQLMLRCWSTADARPNFKLCLKNIVALRKSTEDVLLSPIDI